MRERLNESFIYFIFILLYIVTVKDVDDINRMRFFFFIILSADIYIYFFSHVAHTVCDDEKKVSK